MENVSGLVKGKMKLIIPGMFRGRRRNSLTGPEACTGGVVIIWSDRMVLPEGKRLRLVSLLQTRLNQDENRTVTGSGTAARSRPSLKASRNGRASLSAI